MSTEEWTEANDRIRGGLYGDMLFAELDKEREVSQKLAEALRATRDRLRTYLTRGGKSEVLRQADAALALYREAK